MICSLLATIKEVKADQGLHKGFFNILMLDFFAAALEDNNRKTAAVYFDFLAELLVLLIFVLKKR